MTRLAAASLAALALLAARAHAGEAPGPASFDYLYILAHEGNASGGHAAIRFGADTFDFQHQDGWLVPRREASRRFQHSYRTLENRGIEVSRVAAAPETVALLREAFEQRFLAQSRQLELLGEMQRDAALLEALAKGQEARLPVRGAGFFADLGAESAHTPAALSELRAQIAARHGAGWLAKRRDAALRALRDTALPAQDPVAPRADPFAYPVAADSFSRRTAQALAAVTATELLMRPRPLRAGVRAGEGLAGDPWLALDSPMRARLLEVREALLDAATALAASRRPDWGEALLLACARLVAIDESLASGRLSMLDAFPANAKLLRVGSRRRALLPALEGEARRDFIAAHQQVFAGTGFREASWTELEEAVTRLEELRAVEAGADQMRVVSGTTLPEGLATLPVSPRPASPPAEVARAAQEARAAAHDYRSALEAHSRYDVLSRNCVSELFRTIEAGLASAPGAPDASDREALRAFVEREEVHRLGGYVDPLAAANFIPFVSSRHVRESWRVGRAMHLPSAREYALAREGGFGAVLRESNVLTSSFYEPAENAGFFLFFTDGAWPLRPLLGAANLASALARSGIGLLELPFDRGQGLRAGLDGALWSLPELFFTNIRKGTSEYVPPAERPPPG